MRGVISVSGQRGKSDRRLVSGERDAARRGDAHPQAGEAAGPDGDGDTVEFGKLQRGGVHHPRDQRHQRFGMAADHRHGFARAQVGPLGVENRGGADS